MDEQERKVGTIDETLELSLEKNEEVSRKKPKKREKVKNSRIKNSKKTASVYTNKVRWLNKDTGLYEEFDNTLQKTEDGLETVNGLCRVKFPGEENRSKTVRMSSKDGNYTVSWEYLGSNPRKTVEGRVAKKFPTPVLSKRKVKQQSKKNFPSLERELQTITYSEIASGVDIEYELSNNRLKENIIISRRKRKYEFLFRLNSENLAPEIAEDRKSIEFYSKDTREDGSEAPKKIFKIPTPMMSDAAGANSLDVYYTLDHEESQSGSYLFKVIADSKWINAEKRVFPVTIDPGFVYVVTEWYGQEYDYYNTYICPEDPSCGSESYYSYGNVISFSCAEEQSEWAASVNEYEEEDYYGYHYHGYSTWTEGEYYPLLESFYICCDTTRMEINSSATCAIVPTPWDAYNTAVTWTSSDPSIVSVSSSGDLTSYTNTGTCIITATNNYCPSITDDLVVYVQRSLTDFSLIAPELLAINSSQACSIIPTPCDADESDVTDFTWTSNNPAVSVSSSGVLTAHSRGGASIRATHTSTGLMSSAAVIVYVPMISFTIDGPTTMDVNSSDLCCVVPNPCNAYYQENSDFTWTSSNPSILTVSSSGELTSNVNTGTCMITATHKIYTNLTDSIEVTVSGGEYYINNKYTGKFFTTNDYCGLFGTVYSGSGYKNWMLHYLGSGEYSIVSTKDSYLILYSTNTGNLSIYDDGIPDIITDIYYKWTMTVANDGGYILKNVGSEKVLYDNGSSIVLHDEMSFENIDYSKSVWRIVHPGEYENRNLTDFSVTLTKLYINDSGIPVINKSPLNALWADAEDFLYSTVSNVVFINNEQHKIAGNQPGTATITATHKVTNHAETFDVTVKSGEIIILPGVMGSQLFAQGNCRYDDDSNHYFPAGTRLWDPSTEEAFQAPDKINALAMNEDGESVNPISKEWVTINDNTKNENGFQYGAKNYFANIYKTAYDTYYELGYDIILYEYDWRVDPYDTALRLDAFITEHNYGKITFVSHSMGGVVSSYYLSLGESQRNKVNKHISIGTPYLGSAKIPHIYLMGYIFSYDTYDNYLKEISEWFLTTGSNLLLTNAIKNIMPNIPSTYALLPFPNDFIPYIIYSAADPEEVQIYITYWLYKMLCT